MLAFVSFPNAPLTQSLVRDALKGLTEHVVFTDDRIAFDDAVKSSSPSTRLLQYCSYDHLDHELTHAQPEHVLASSYTIRKSLIRKHYLHRALSSYVAKHPDSILATSVPHTWDIDIAWADELDELFADELWDLGEILDNNSERWFILKPGMADRGNGIRLFNSKEALRTIFEEFEDQSDGESTEIGVQDIIASQLRHFVIQEYITHPLLVDPSQALSLGKTVTTAEPLPYKFHLRAYCIACGTMTLYLWPHILALFACVPYSVPSHDTVVELAPHLTNTSLQMDRGDAGVRLLNELAGCSVLSTHGNGNLVLSISDIARITDQIAHIVADTFQAALASPVHFQSLPNAFELYGVDLLVTPTLSPHWTGSSGYHFQTHLLEINAEPAIELTGPRLRWVLEDMFKAMAKVCIGPFFGVRGCEWESWKVGETREGLRKCLEVQVRGREGW
ncbi:tubulin-tyrosine ligase, partial [Ramaria rubella]